MLLRTDPEGRTWAVVTEPGEFETPSPDELVGRLRAATARGRAWPAARRLDAEGLWTTNSIPPAGAAASPTGLDGWRAGVLAALAAIGSGRLD